MKRIRVLLSAMLLALFPLLFGCGLLVSAPEAAAEPTPAPDPIAAARAYEAAGQEAEARAAYEEAFALDPRDTELLRKLIALSQNWPDKLIGYYDDLSMRDVMTEDELLSYAALLERQALAERRCLLLERAQRLSPSEEKQALLELTVLDFSTLNDAAQTAAGPVLAAMRAGDLEAAADALFSGAFYDALRSTIPGGARRYRSSDADGVLTAELRANGEILLHHLGGTGELRALHLDADTLTLTRARYESGAFNGAFTSTRYEAVTGSMFTDAGTFQSGVLTGAFTTKACFGTEKTALSTLLSARDTLETASFSGEFNETGHAKAEQQKAVSGTGVVYAYQDDDKNRYIYALDPDGLGASAFVFGTEFVGVTPPPAW